MKITPHQAARSSSGTMRMATWRKRASTPRIPLSHHTTSLHYYPRRCHTTAAAQTTHLPTSSRKRSWRLSRINAACKGKSRSSTGWRRTGRMGRSWRESSCRPDGPSNHSPLPSRSHDSSPVERSCVISREPPITCIPQQPILQLSSF